MGRARRVSFCFPTDRLVSPEQTRPTVAAYARSIRDLGERGDVAADAGQNGDSVLGTLDARIADDSESRARQAGTRFEIVGRARLLLACAEFAESGAANRGEARRDFSE